MEHNDELLLALGWKKDIKPDGFWHGNWFDPSGSLVRGNKVPEPFESVDDAIACVPEGHQWLIRHHGYKHGKYMGKFMARIYSPASSGGGPKWEAFSDESPSKALSQAIRKAIEQ